MLGWILVRGCGPAAPGNAWSSFLPLRYFFTSVRAAFSVSSGAGIGSIKVFSTKRAALLPFMPNQFDFSPVAAGVNPVGQPRDAANDLLTLAVLAKINAAAPAVAAGSPADEFRALLNSPDAVKELDKRVADYLAQVKTKLDTAPANAAIRKDELERLFKLAIARRDQMEKHPVLGNLDETGGQLLLPLVP